MLQTCLTQLQPAQVSAVALVLLGFVLLLNGDFVDVYGGIVVFWGLGTRSQCSEWLREQHQPNLTLACMQCVFGRSPVVVWLPCWCCWLHELLWRTITQQVPPIDYILTNHPSLVVTSKKIRPPPNHSTTAKCP